MGMYTEFHMCVRLKRTMPKEVEKVLKYMTMDMREQLDDVTITENDLPTHPLFTSGRWAYMLKSDSYYFAMIPGTVLEYDDIAHQYFLSIRTNLKNYDNEIEKFIDFIMPYVDDRNECYGYFRYEEDQHPTLIYHDKLVDVGKLLESA